MGRSEREALRVGGLMPGYTAAELDDIQAKWDLRFPPDLVALYRERRRVIEHEDERFGSFDWLSAPNELIQSALSWPFEGFWFDVQHNPLRWWPEWGDMPSALEERRDLLLREFEKAPKLIPIFGHRYIPNTPSEEGNPVFSVYQMDVIPYGANLSDYVARETGGYLYTAEWPALKEIPFWSRAVEMNTAYFKQHKSARFFNKDGMLP